MSDWPVRPPVDGQCRRRPRGEFDRGATTASGSVAQAHAAKRGESGEEVFHRQENLLRREHRTLAVVTPVLEPIPGVRPERRRRLVDVPGEDDDGAGRKIVRQRGGFRKEQGQVVLDSGRPASLTDFPVDRAPRGVALEPPPPRAPERRHRVRGRRELAGREQLDAVDPARGTLAVGIEQAQALDLVVEKIDAQRRFGPHGEEIEQRAPHRVLAVLHHLADARVSGAVESPAKGVDVEVVAGLDEKPVTVDESARGNPPHRGAGHGDQHSRSERRKPPQGFESFRDEILVRREEIVGQRLPVREAQVRGLAVQEERQLGFEAVSGPAVRGDDEHRGIGLPRETCDGQTAGAAVQRRPPGPRSPPRHSGDKRRDRLHGDSSFRGVRAARSRRPVSRPRRTGHAPRPGRRPVAAPAAVRRAAGHRSDHGSTC